MADFWELTWRPNAYGNGIAADTPAFLYQIHRLPRGWRLTEWAKHPGPSDSIMYHLRCEIVFPGDAQLDEAKAAAQAYAKARQP